VLSLTVITLWLGSTGPSIGGALNNMNMGVKENTQAAQNSIDNLAVGTNAARAHTNDAVQILTELVLRVESKVDTLATQVKTQQTQYGIQDLRLNELYTKLENQE